MRKPASGAVRARTALSSLVVVVVALIGCQAGAEETETTDQAIANDTAACQLIDPAVRRATLIALHASGAPPFCSAGDDDCPCGAYCAPDGVCRVDCLADMPPPDLACGVGLECTPLGRCADAPDDPGPTIAFAIEVDPPVLVADTAAGPATVTAEVTLVANSLDAVDLVGDATVFAGLAERRDPDATGLPLVRCATAAAFDDGCEFDTAWTFDVVSGSLRSAPRAVEVQLPQGVTEAAWTLEVRSDGAEALATSVVRAVPAVHPAHDRGRYRGTVRFDNPGTTMDTLLEPGLELDVEAVVTATHVALIEPTRLLLPQGQIVLPRAAGQVTLLRWLTSDATVSPVHLDARLSASALDYDAATGTLAATIALADDAAHPEDLDLALARADEPVVACTTSPICGTGAYCNTVMQVCLPGAAPPTQSIVAATAPAAQLVGNGAKSGLFEAWGKKAAMVAEANPAHLGGTGVSAIESAYCYRNPGQLGLGWLRPTVILEPSLDLACNDGLPQRTFAHANASVEAVGQPGSETFDLLASCLADLAVIPGVATPASILPERTCASLGRFILTLLPYSSTDLPDRFTQSRIVQVVRQWLGVQAYVANAITQDQARHDALGDSAAPAHQRLGGAVDLVERGWRLLLDARVRRQFTAGPGVEGSTLWPDYRTAGRPATRWTFNHPTTPLADTEGDVDLRDCDGAEDGELRVPWHYEGAPAPAPCTTDVGVALPPQSFSIAGRMWLPITEYEFFVAQRAGEAYFTITHYRESDEDYFDVWSHDLISGHQGYAHFGPGDVNNNFLVFTFDGALPRLIVHGQEFSPLYLTNGGPRWPAGATAVSFNTWTPQPADDNEELSTVAASFDDVSLWDHALTLSEVNALALGYSQTTDPQPPRSQLTTEGPQILGLPVHVVEAATAYLGLIARYVDAERAMAYEECLAGAGSPARDRALDRAGRAMRVVRFLTAEAARLAAVPGMAAAPWYPRYTSALATLAAARRTVVEAIRETATCSNPLGISDQDLPLFRGEVDGTVNQFFASSRALAALARTEAERADAELGDARAAYQAQRTSAYQVAMSAIAKQERMDNLHREYEQVLRRYCGAPSAGQSLLDQFLAGTLDVSTCYLTPACAGMANTPIADIPPSCLRGEIGERLVAIQSAALASAKAIADMDRAIDRFNIETIYCAQRQAHHRQTELDLAAHNENMRKLREQRQNAGMMGGWAGEIGLITAAVVTGNPALAVAAVTNGIDLIKGRVEEDMAQNEAEEQAAYELSASTRAHELDLMACFHGADLQRYAIQEAREVIKHAYHSGDAATANLENAKQEVVALVDDAHGRLATEAATDRTPPHHHYWLDESIEQFDRHMRYARRLAYLALRAFEWEAQESLGLGGAAMTAALPDDVLQIVEALEQRNGPMQDELGIIGDTTIVLSLRDEILRLEDLATSTTPLPGDPPLTAEGALRRLLASDATKIYEDGEYLGHGIRFPMEPAAWSQFTCAERTWKVSVSLQIDSQPGGGELNNGSLVLLQSNAFASQQCRAAERGELHVARVTPFKNLLTGDAPPAFTESPSHTAMRVDANKNLTRATLETMPAPGEIGFAGRGVFGQYILLFPSETFEPTGQASWLPRVRDVLIRFDLVEVTNAPL
jgi:hypothetical protein